MLKLILNGLLEGDFGASIAAMRSWLATAKPGEPAQMLRSCAPEHRAKVALLMKDLLSRFPATVIGAPVLLKWTPEGTQRRIKLPFPSIELLHPCKDLMFLGWLGAETQVPLAFPFAPEKHTVFIEAHKVTAAVALFKTHPGVFDLNEIEMPDAWWANLLIGIPGSMNVSSRMLLPYPDALDAAQCMLAAATEQPSPDAVFIGATAKLYAETTGSLYLEGIRNQSPGQFI